MRRKELMRCDAMIGIDAGCVVTIDLRDCFKYSASIRSPYWARRPGGYAAPLPT